MSSKLTAVVLAAALTLGVAACGSDKANSSSSPATTVPKVDLSKASFEDHTGQKSVTIKVVDNNFEPQYATISPGTTVTFVNAGRNKHDVMPVDPKAFRDITIDNFAPGSSAKVEVGTKATFDKPGDFPYYCTLHGTVTKGMTGAIRVAAK